jgi:hypothetical protein
MAGINRIHGGVTAETLHGGYQQTFLKITGGSTQFTADAVDGTTLAITEGGFSKAIKAIQTIATIVYIGTRADTGFIVAVDGATAQPDGPAFDSTALGSITLAARVDSVVTDAVGGTVTVVVPGMLAANVS